MRNTLLDLTQLVIFQGVLTRVCGLRQPAQLHQWVRRYMCNPFMTLKLGIRQVCFTIEGSECTHWATRERELNVCCGDLRWGRECSKMYFFQNSSLPSVCLAYFYLSLKPQITASLETTFLGQTSSLAHLSLKGLHMSQ